LVGAPKDDDKGASSGSAYVFDLSAGVTAPEIAILGNGMEIAAGDQTPSPEDHTDFGAAEVGGEPLERSFTITNAGPGALYLNGAPTVAIDGPVAGDFTVLQMPQTPLAAGTSTSFSVRFTPSAGGARAATLRIGNNDADESPYVFAILGTGLTAPEIALTGNGQAIADGDTTPSPDDHTDFGVVDIAAGRTIRVFIIRNLGSAPLTLTAEPPVALAGPAAADFQVIAQPTTPIPPGGSAEVQVRFAPTAVGLRQATLVIANDDADEDPYDIALAGTAVSAPEIAVSGAGIDIAAGDASPSPLDGTDFGAADIADGQVTHAFIIDSQGSATLRLTGSPPVQIDGAGDFVVVTAPQTEIPAGSATSFEVRFDPATAGLHQAVIRIANDDEDEAQFSFAIQGSGTATPDIGLEGGGLPIGNGDDSPNPTDSTDFGPADIDSGQVMHGFGIRNSGSGPLTLTGSPPVQLVGDQAGDFAVTIQPETPIDPGAVASFQIRFDPTGIGLRKARVRITSDDPDESPYGIDIQGTGTAVPEIELTGNGQAIADGDATPSPDDHTDFGNADILTGGVTHGFTIHNSGSGPLTLAATPATLTGPAAGDFSIEAQPNTPIPPAAAQRSWSASTRPTSVCARPRWQSAATTPTNPPTTS
jgi:hypothetical protein